MAPTIKRENWKGRFIVVARDEKGKILSRIKYSSKIPISFWQNKFKNTGSFRDEVFVTKLKKVQEITDLSAKPKIRKNLGRYQVVITGFVNKKRISARSRNFDVDEPRKAAIEQAIESFWQRVDERITGGYDALNGMKYKEKVSGVRIGIVQYKTL